MGKNCNFRICVFLCLYIYIYYTCRSLTRIGLLMFSCLSGHGVNLIHETQSLSQRLSQCLPHCPSQCLPRKRGTRTGRRCAPRTPCVQAMNEGFAKKAFARTLREAFCEWLCEWLCKGLCGNIQIPKFQKYTNYNTNKI